MHHATDGSKETSSSALYTLYGVQSIEEIACDDLSKRLTLLGNSWLSSSINAGKTRKSSRENDIRAPRSFTNVTNDNRELPNRKLFETLNICLDIKRVIPETLTLYIRGLSPLVLIVNSDLPWALSKITSFRRNSIAHADWTGINQEAITLKLVYNDSCCALLR